ncbi:MAG TPA: hypothetical protein VF582_00480 [Allosphingosinicella sp.]|jgi:hypothetical protein
MPLIPVTIALAAAAAAGQPVDRPLVLTPLELQPRPMYVEIERDAITDALSAFAIARAHNGRLFIGCDPDRYRGIRVSFRSQSWLAEEGILARTRGMTYRFDQTIPVRARWDIDNDTATLRPWADVPVFVSWLVISRRLVIRSKDIEDRERDLVFSLEGGRPAIDKMLEVCRLSVLRRTLGRR